MCNLFCVDSTSSHSISDKLTILLAEANRGLIVRTASTHMWQIDYTHITDLGKDATDDNSQNSPKTDVPDGRLRLTNSLFRNISKDTSDQPSILDKYNQSKSVYQLSYLSDEEFSDVEIEETVSSPTTALATQSVSIPKTPSSGILMPSIRSLPAGSCLDPVSDFIETLRTTESDVANRYSSSALPYPPVDHFELGLIEARLNGDLTTPIPSAASWTDKIEKEKKPDALTALQGAALRGELEMLSISPIQFHHAPSSTSGSGLGKHDLFSFEPMSSILQRFTVQLSVTFARQD